jgi:hypothetical protein
MTNPAETFTPEHSPTSRETLDALYGKQFVSDVLVRYKEAQAKLTERFSPAHVRLVYEMVRKTNKRAICSVPASQTLNRQSDHWAGRWAKIPDADVAAARLF